MYSTMLRSDHQKTAYFVLGLFFLLQTAQQAIATEFQVGGSGTWTVPSDPNALQYNQWAEKKRFQVGDSILFIYPQANDSVLYVSSEDYTNCNTSNPIQEFTGGRTSFVFVKSGPHHFISGNKENCLKNEKMVAVVMADRTNHSSSDVLSPPPSGSSDITPSPPPVDEGSPPEGTVEITPTLAPVSEESPSTPSEGCSMYVHVIGSFGVFIVSLIHLIV